MRLSLKMMMLVFLLSLAKGETRTHGWVFDKGCDNQACDNGFSCGAAYVDELCRNCSLEECSVLADEANAEHFSYRSTLKRWCRKCTKEQAQDATDWGGKDWGIYKHGYELILSPKMTTQEHGLAYCQSLGGYPVVPKNQAETETIRAMLPESAVEGQKQVWIGIHKENGNWVRYDGKSLQWTNWMGNEGTSGELDASMRFEESDNDGVRWNGEWYDINAKTNARDLLHYTICTAPAGTVVLTAGYSLKLSPELTTQEDGLEYCKSLGGYPVVPANQQDTDTIRDMLPDTPEQKRVWLGIHREAGWVRYDGKILQWMNWKGSEGNVWSELNAGMIFDNGAWNGKWWDLNPSVAKNPLYYTICSIPPRIPNWAAGSKLVLRPDKVSRGTGEDYCRSLNGFPVVPENAEEIETIRAMLPPEDVDQKVWLGIKKASAEWLRFDQKPLTWTNFKDGEGYFYNAVQNQKNALMSFRGTANGRWWDGIWDDKLFFAVCTVPVEYFELVLAPGEMTQEDGLAYCHNEGGYPVVPTHDLETEIITNLLPQPIGLNKGVWLGINKNVAAGHYHWTRYDGTALRWKNFMFEYEGSGPPNGNQNEPHAFMKYDKYKRGDTDIDVIWNGDWKDRNNGNRLLYTICAVPGVRSGVAETLIMKLKAGSDVFKYESAYWTNDQTLNPSETTASENDDIDAKLEAFNTMRLNAIKICYGTLTNCYTYDLGNEYPNAAALFNSGFISSDNIGGGDQSPEDAKRAFTDIFLPPTDTSPYNRFWNGNGGGNCDMQRPGINTQCRDNNWARIGYCVNLPNQSCQSSSNSDADSPVGIGLKSQDYPNNINAPFGQYFVHSGNEIVDRNMKQAWVFILTPANGRRNLAQVPETKPCVGTWVEHGPCSVTCGTGVKLFEFSVTQESQYGGECEANHGTLKQESCMEQVCQQSPCRQGINY